VLWVPPTIIWSADASPAAARPAAKRAIYFIDNLPAKGVGTSFYIVFLNMLTAIGDEVKSNKKTGRAAGRGIWANAYIY
jgi:hypothetical protein